MSVSIHLLLGTCSVHMKEEFDFLEISRGYL